MGMRTDLSAPVEQWQTVSTASLKEFVDALVEQVLRITFRHVQGAACFKQLIATHSALHKDGYYLGGFDGDGVIQFCEICTVFSKKIRVLRKHASPHARVSVVSGSDLGSGSTEIVIDDDRADAIVVLLNGLLGGHEQRVILSLIHI